SSLREKRCLSFVRTISSRVAWSKSTPLDAEALMRVSQSTQPFGSRWMPIFPGSWRRTRLRNLLMRFEFMGAVRVAHGFQHPLPLIMESGFEAGGIGVWVLEAEDAGVEVLELMGASCADGFEGFGRVKT